MKNTYLTLLFVCTFAIYSHAQNITFQTHTVDNYYDGPAGLNVADLNNDAKLDIICAALDANSIAYWKNDGGIPIIWSKVIIDDDFNGAIYVSSGDVDGDGYIDVLGAAYEGDELAWWRNMGNDEWTKYSIKENYTEAHEIMTYDIDQDGDMDVLGVSAGLNTIIWFENDGNFPISWTEHIIVEDFAGVRSIDAKDIDGDGDIDLAGAALLDHEIAWWRNDGGTPIVFTKITINTSFTYAHKVQIVDMDNDGHQDILGTAYNNGISWWKNGGDAPVTWTKKTVSSYNTAVISWAIDADNDNDYDIIGSAQGTSKLSIWENLENALEWDYSIIDNLGGAWPLYYGDLDNDGDIDLVCAGNSANRIRWYENNLYQNETVVDYDGNNYNTVVIGEQTWLKENLKSLHYSDGTEITEVWAYGDDETNVDIYGRLYTWNAAMNYTATNGAQGACPIGWHLPTDSEWSELGNYLGGDDIAGGKLKSTGTELWQTPNTGATNESGFTALPAGEYDDTHYQLINQYAVMWSSTETSDSWCKYRYLSYDNDELSTFNYYKDFRYSIRCLKDGTVGLEEQGAIEKKIEISPNPAQETIKITSFGGNDYPLNVRFYDISSRLVKAVIAHSDKSTIDISGLPSGMYFVHVFQGNRSETVKLLKK